MPNTSETEASFKECPYCGEKILLQAKKCKHCQEFIDPSLREIENLRRNMNHTPIAVNNNNNNALHVPAGNYSMTAQKSRLLYIVLALLLGMLGIHNFYAGYTGTGIIQLILTLTWFLAIITLIWVIIDILFTTKDGRGVPFA